MPLRLRAQLNGNKMGLVRTLIDCDKEDAEAALPQGLRAIRRGFALSSITCCAPLLSLRISFSTLDGVISYEIEDQAGGSTLSGSHPADRFIIGLLQASADAVMVGARTVHDVSSEGPVDS